MKTQKPYVQRRWLVTEWVWIAWAKRGGGEFPFYHWEDAMSCALGQRYPSPESLQTRKPSTAA